jgi:hypothetical protein
MRVIHRRRATLTGFALAAVSGAAVFVTASPAGADESKAACVAVLTHDPAIGAPGAAQRRLHLTYFGQAIASIADQPKGQCVYPYGGGGR